MNAIAHDDAPSLPLGGTVRVPDVIPIFPLSSTVLLPGEVLPLHIFEPRYRAMVEDALQAHRVIGMVERLPTHGRSGDVSGVRDFGCVGYIGQHRKLPDGRLLIWLLGLERFHIDTELESDHLYRMMRVTYLPTDDLPGATAANVPLASEIRTVLPGLLAVDEDALSAISEHMGAATDQQLVALTAQLLEMPSRRKQQLLETDSMHQRLMMVIEDLYQRAEALAALDGVADGHLN